MTVKERILILVGKNIDRIQFEKNYESITIRFEKGVFKMFKTENTKLADELDKLIQS